MFTTNIINYFFSFDKAGCTRCFFSKTHQSSLTLKGGSTAFPKPFFSWRRLAALGNMKANFHCAHLHNLSPQGTRDVPTALLVLFSKINPSFFTIKEGSTSFSKPFSPQGTRDVSTALLVLTFRKSTRPSLPLRKAPPLISVFSPQGKRGNRPTRCSNRYAIRLADHQRSTPAAELRFFVRG